MNACRKTNMTDIKPILDKNKQFSWVLSDFYLLFTQFSCLRSVYVREQKKTCLALS